jgi:hypothetical protein
MKKEKLTIEQYESLTAMLNSNTIEDKVLGLTTIENLDFKTNLTMFLLLKKKTNVSLDLWKKHATKTTNKFKKVGIQIEKHVTYKEILKAIVKNKQSEKEIQFFLDDFSKHLFKTIEDLGFDFIEDTQITIKLKKNDKTGITSESI